MHSLNIYWINTWENDCIQVQGLLFTGWLRPHSEVRSTVAFGMPLFCHEPPWTPVLTGYLTLYFLYLSLFRNISSFPEEGRASLFKIWLSIREPEKHPGWVCLWEPSWICNAPAASAVPSTSARALMNHFHPYHKPGSQVRVLFLDKNMHPRETRTWGDPSSRSDCLCLRGADRRRVCYSVRKFPPRRAWIQTSPKSQREKWAT